MTMISIITTNTSKTRMSAFSTLLLFIGTLTFGNVNSADITITSKDGSRLFMNNEELLTIKCKIKTDNEVNHTHFTPELVMSNSSWSRTFDLTADYPANTDMSSMSMSLWTVGILRMELHNWRDWKPKEPWMLKLYGDIGTASATMMDITSEPLIQWDLGEYLGVMPIQNDSASPVASELIPGPIHLTTYPCSLDVALICYTKDGDLYFTYTHDGFSGRPIPWFKISADKLCGAGCELQVFDTRLTSHRLFIATNHGLYISGDIRDRPPDYRSYNAKPTLSFSHAFAPGCYLNEAKLGYTAMCQFRPDEVVREELVTFKYTCDSGESLFKYSIDGFDSWKTVVLPGNKEILDAAYNIHIDAINFLVKKGSRTAAYMYRFEDGILLTKARFPPFEFSETAQIRRLHYHPKSHNLYAVGKEIFLSDDSGNSFQLVMRLDQDKDVKQVFFSQYGILMRCQNGVLMHGKTGLLRMVDISEQVKNDLGAALDYTVHTDIFGITKVVQLLISGNMAVRHINISYMIQINTLSAERAFGYQLIQKNEAVFFEYSHTSNVSFFSNASVGHEFQYINGGYGYISYVTMNYKAKHPGFLSRVHIDIQEHFAVARKSLSRENSINVVNYNPETHEATLVLSPGLVGWDTTDLYNTIVLPLSTNFFLTRYSNSTHFHAVAFIPIAQYTIHNAFEWIVMDFSSTSLWLLKEAACRFSLNVLFLNNIARFGYLDVRDTAVLTIVSSLEEGKLVSYETEM